jgi:ATP-dependent HslUV protease ATP-binding subunit HslU
LVKTPRSETTQEGVVAEVAVSAPLSNSAKNTEPTPPLPVIERRNPDGTAELVIVVDPEYVRHQVASIVKSQDLSRYIL